MGIIGQIIMEMKRTVTQWRKILKASKISRRFLFPNNSFRLSFMKKINRYFGSEWSLAQFKVYEKKTKVVFGQETNSLYIVGYDGNFYIVNFDPSNGGECLKQFEGRYI